MCLPMLPLVAGHSLPRMVFHTAAPFRWLFTWNSLFLLFCLKAPTFPLRCGSNITFSEKLVQLSLQLPASLLAPSQRLLRPNYGAHEYIEHPQWWYLITPLSVAPRWKLKVRTVPSVFDSRNKLLVSPTVVRPCFRKLWLVRQTRFLPFQGWVRRKEQ